MRRIIFLLALVLPTPATRGQDPIFLTFYDTTLYRFTLDGPIETFALADSFTAAAADPRNNRVYLASDTDNDVDSNFELYALNSPLASPTVSMVGDILDNLTRSLTWIDGTLYGTQVRFVPFPGETEHSLVMIDPVGQSQSVVGASGDMGALPHSTGYEPSTGLLFGVDNSENFLRDIDWDLSEGPDPTASPIGSTGVASTASGGEFYNGTYYHVYINTSATNASELTLGTINTTTGAFTPVRVVDTDVAPGALGLAIIPEPTGLVLLLSGSLALLRRRRT